MSALMGLVTLTFDLLTLKLIRESHKVWNLTSKFGHVRPLGSRIELFTMYATDRRTDEMNAYCPLPYAGGGVIRAASGLDSLS